ncbi:hypothetical protein [Dyadobacter sp. CY323]|uniref:hypothetical protein n=1 Tax=Dyadobacter sp. CY323 TaxID=2907302 RepID=UPI001F1ABD3F|nr:hypothetical protein [Dyadobacter sp. CY323]MCE6991219.1 hypothetical protein [Dyadobacter sp. CY323]
MENENLFYRIRELVHKPDKSDREWDPDKFWNLFEARKRRRQVWVRASYSMAAMLVLAAGFAVFVSDNTFRSVETKFNAGAIPQVGTDSPAHLAQTQIGKTAQNDAGTNVKYPSAERRKKSRISHKTSADLGSNKLESNAGTALPSFDVAISKAPDNDLFIEQSTRILDEENSQMPSLLLMFEQAQKERELRNQSVQLGDRKNYNRFWLTVNQHLLANKINSNALHYDRY